VAGQRKDQAYESPIPEEEIAARMSSTAGRKLEKRLETMGWADGQEPDGTNAENG